MPDYRFSPRAETDIAAILEWTHENFGEKARVRYEALLVRAIRDVAEAPERAGSRARPEIAGEARTYHLRHSRDRVERSVGRVKRPRHFLLYRISRMARSSSAVSSTMGWTSNVTFPMRRDPGAER